MIHREIRSCLPRADLLRGDNPVLMADALYALFALHQPILEWSVYEHDRERCPQDEEECDGSPCPAERTYRVCAGCLPCDFGLISVIAEEHDVQDLSWPCTTLQTIQAHIPLFQKEKNMWTGRTVSYLERGESDEKS